MYKRHIVGEIGEKIANKYLVENVKDVRIETTVFHLLSYLLPLPKFYLL